MIQSNCARFLTLLRILVDETTEGEPMTKHQLMRRCDDYGCYLTPNTFDKYIKDMAEGGIVIRRRLAEGKQRGDYLYWYADGWI